MTEILYYSYRESVQSVGTWVAHVTLLTELPGHPSITGITSRAEWSRYRVNRGALTFPMIT